MRCASIGDRVATCSVRSIAYPCAVRFVLSGLSHDASRRCTALLTKTIEPRRYRKPARVISCTRRRLRESGNECIEDDANPFRNRAALWTIYMQRRFDFGFGIVGDERRCGRLKRFATAKDSRPRTATRAIDQRRYRHRFERLQRLRFAAPFDERRRTDDPHLQRPDHPRDETVVADRRWSRTGTLAISTGTRAIRWRSITSTSFRIAISMRQSAPAWNSSFAPIGRAMYPGSLPHAARTDPRAGN